MADPGFRQRAEDLGERIRAEDGVGRAAERVLARASLAVDGRVRL